VEYGSDLLHVAINLCNKLLKLFITGYFGVFIQITPAFFDGFTELLPKGFFIYILVSDIKPPSLPLIIVCLESINVA
jgi:hypothetical protein